MPTYQRINSATVGASAPFTITFSAIPQTYTDLKVVASVRSSRGVSYEDGNLLQINSTTSGYNYILLEWQGTTVSTSNTGYEQTWAMRIPAAITTSNVFSNYEFTIPNYAQTVAKNYIGFGVGERNDTVASITMATIRNPATAAITEITLSAANGNFVQYSTAYLYGISNA